MTGEDNLDLQIARQCAPLLAGIKISNLFITKFSNLENVYRIFGNTNVKVVNIHVTFERSMLFLYQPMELAALLNTSEVSCFMSDHGYKNMDAEEILKQLSLNFAAYKRGLIPFPHEIGILLGYPVEDVKGFIENHGQKYIYAGYWKVYRDLDQALDTFQQYRRAQDTITHLVAGGLNIIEILQRQEA